MYDKQYVVFGIDPGEMTGVFSSVFTEANGNVVSINLGDQYSRSEVMQNLNHAIN